LKELNLSGNQIKDLPENIFRNLISLEWLFLYKNKLENLNENLLQRLRSKNVKVVL
jgi:Leucine-rich repeat (LRR) protein